MHYHVASKHSTNVCNVCFGKVPVGYIFAEWSELSSAPTPPRTAWKTNTNRVAFLAVGMQPIDECEVIAHEKHLEGLECPADETLNVYGKEKSIVC